jgi:urease accessory protein
VSHGDEKMLEEIRKCILREDDALLGCTLLHGDLLLMRYLGNSTFAAHGLFAEIWAMLRPEIMGRTPCVPRIWAT